MHYENWGHKPLTLILPKCGRFVQAQSSDFVGEPDAEGPSAATSLMAVAAKDPACPKRFSLRAGLVKSVEGAMSDESVNGLAVGTGGLLEALGDRDPSLLGAVEPLFVAHSRSMLPGKSLTLLAAN